MKKKMRDEAKVGVVTLVCMFILAFTAAYKGTFVNPIALAAPGYMFIIKIIVGSKCSVIQCSLIMIAVTMLALTWYVI